MTFIGNFLFMVALLGVSSQEEIVQCTKAGSCELIPMHTVASLIRRSEVLSEWPTVSKAVLHGVVKPEKFLKQRVIIPVAASVTLQRDAVRNENTIRAAVEHGLQEKLRAQLDDPELQKSIYMHISKELYHAFETHLKDRERTENTLEYLMNRLVGNKFSFQQTLETEVKGSRALTQIEGGATVTNERSWISQDHVTFQLDFSVKMISFDRKTLGQLEASEKMRAQVKECDVADLFLD